MNKYAVILIGLLASQFSLAEGPDDFSIPGAHSHGDAYSKSDHTHTVAPLPGHTHEPQALPTPVASPWYLGAGFGLSSVNCEKESLGIKVPYATASNSGGDYTPPPIHDNISDCDNSDDSLSYRAFVGRNDLLKWRNINVALELGYSIFSGGNSEDNSALTLETLLKMDFKYLTPFVSFGKALVSNENSNLEQETVSGFGVEYHIDEFWHIRGQYQKISDFDIDNVSLSLVHNIAL